VCCSPTGTDPVVHATEPDPLTGKRRRLSRSINGTRSDAVESPQRLVVESGAGLQARLAAAGLGPVRGDISDDHGRERYPCRSSSPEIAARLGRSTATI